MILVGDVCSRSTSWTMGCPTDTALMESTKYPRKTPRKATMEPSSTPALMPTKDLVRVLFHYIMCSSPNVQEVLWAL